jgi:Flp pilus assembly pilin Flp
MRLHRHLSGDESGAAAVEMALALPVMIVMIWAFVQLAQIYRASAGIQQALGQGARFATLCVPSAADGCDIPSGDEVHDRMMATVYGIGPGDFTANTPTKQTAGTTSYYDLEVTYTQPTNLLIFPGPTIHIDRTKRVWVASNA